MKVYALISTYKYGCYSQDNICSIRLTKEELKN